MLPTILFQIPLNVGSDIQQFARSEFFVYLIPFLLSFALVYGLLSQTKVPKDPQVRAVVSLLFGFLVLPAAPIMTRFLSPLSGSLLILVGGLLMFIILIELLGLSDSIKGKQIVRDEEGKPKLVDYEHKKPLFSRHATGFTLLLISVAVIIFANSGGLGLLGISTPQFFLNAPLLFFLVVIFLVVYFVSLKE